VLGAFVAAILYETVGLRAARDARPDQFQSTTSITVSFLRPVRPGRIVGRGRVAHRDGQMAFVEAALMDSTGNTIATAAATARVIRLSEARDAA
jgi:acyl-coenzyme A thioesterase PaaI-like protein